MTDLVWLKQVVLLKNELKSNGNNVTYNYFSHLKLPFLLVFQPYGPMSYRPCQKPGTHTSSLPLRQLGTMTSMALGGGGSKRWDLVIERLERIYLIVS